MEYLLGRIHAISTINAHLHEINAKDNQCIPIVGYFHGLSFGAGADLWHVLRKTCFGFLNASFEPGHSSGNMLLSYPFPRKILQDFSHGLLILLLVYSLKRLGCEKVSNGPSANHPPIHSQPFPYPTKTTLKPSPPQVDAAPTPA